MKRLGWLWLLLASFLLGTAQAEVAIPPLKQRVTDLTSTLDANQTQTLEAKLAAFEKTKGSQIAILVLPTTQPEVIEQFAIRVVEAWKLGRKGVDDGVLLLIAKDDRKLRIEVGYGLEGALNDATAKRIVAEVIGPAFKQGDFYGGIDAGVTAIIKVIDGEPLPPPASGAQAQGSDSDSLSNLLGIGFVIFMMGNIILRQMLGRLPSGLLVGGAIGAIAWFMLLSLGIAVIVGVIAFILSLIFGSNSGGSSLPVGWGGGGGGWGSSGGSDSWGGGGGGSFGGGGASGDW
ncbi:MAG: YgcG family protein [Sideroxydans sp.]|jgi:uncharacterized protein